MPAVALRQRAARGST